MLFAGGVCTHAAVQLESYSIRPHFVTQSVPPNIMLVVDNSGSMFLFAYFEGWNTDNPDDDNLGTSASNPAEGFDPSFPYYGYFDSAYWYNYSSSNERFSPAALKTSRGKSTNEWDGNFLNWLTMRRTDVLKKVLTGGKTNTSGQLICEPPDGTSRGVYRRVNNAENYGPHSGTVTYKVYQDGESPARARINKYNSSTYYYLTIDPIGTPSGVVQRIGGKARWGLSFYKQNSSGLTHSTDQGGFVDASIMSRDSATLTTEVVNRIKERVPSTNTPLAEVLWGVTGYYAKQTILLGGPGPRYASTDYATDASVDPYNYGTAYAPCARSFVLMITDGEPCSDGYLPPTLANYAHDRSPYNCDAGSDVMSDPCYCVSCSRGGHVPGIEDVALYGHINDLRSDLSGKQNYDFYGVFAFGAGSRLFRYACINGGFVDQNGNNQPDLQQEWDADGDNEPDTFFAAPSGDLLEAKIEAAITGILRRVASGSAVSVLATSAGGEGSLFQAYFRPGVIEGTREVSWLGYLQGFWVDQYGNLREDTAPDKRLIYTQDKIIKYTVNAGGETVIQKFSDADGNGRADSTTADATVSLDNVCSLWEAGTLLASRSAADREIYTYVDVDNDGVQDNGEFIQFVSGNAATLRPYLRAADVAEATNIINFIRGEQIPGCRDRQLSVGAAGNRVWKLGDIIYSSPTVVGKPVSNYDLVYRDASYTPFARANANRDVVVYVGANDGMLHAFWAGVFHQGDDPDTPNAQERGWYTTSSVGSTYGQELWGYIPYNLLPHLKWLASTNYTPDRHVYYVDLEPVSVDVKIPSRGGWRTILLGGMRFGGGPITVTDDFGSGSTTSRTFQSAYFALDVTDPAAPPELLWEFTDARLGFTLARPTVVKIGTNYDYFVVFGSGPNDPESASSSQQGRIFVVDLASGQLRRVIDTSANAFVTSATKADHDLDFSTDVLYLGETFSFSGEKYGKLYRLKTAESADPNTWTLSTLFATEAGQPITSSPEVAYDTEERLWVYFGTGKYLCTYDKSDASQQTYYGIKDPCYRSGCADIVTREELLNTTNVVVATATCAASGAGSGINNQTDLENAIRICKGWYRNLSCPVTTPSERVMNEPVITAGIVYFTAFTPIDNICGYGGNGTLYGLNYLTGAASCALAFPGDGAAPPPVAPFALPLGSGVPSRPTLHEGKGGSTLMIQTSDGRIASERGKSDPAQRPGMIMWREMR